MNLSVFISQDLDAAQKMSEALAGRQAQDGFAVQDAAIVVRQPDGSSQMQPCRDLVGAGTLGGIFWGMFFALLYWSRWWGLNIGSVLNQLSLDEKFVRTVSQAVTRHHSALFILADDDGTRRASEALEPFKPETFSTEISPEDHRRLQSIFGQ